MFAEADVSVAYRAKPVVREKATHTIDFCGLDGAVNFVQLTDADCRRLQTSSIHAAWIASRTFSPPRLWSSSKSGRPTHPVVQVDEAHAARVDVGMRLGERDRDLRDVGPLELHRPSFAWLIVYFGISTTSFSSSTIAWHDRRDSGVRPHARSSRSSSSSDDGGSESKPFAHDAVARRARARLLARVLDARCPGRAGCRAATCRSRPRRSCLRDRSRRAEGRRSRACASVYSDSASTRLPVSARDDAAVHAARRRIRSVTRLSASTAARSAR